jgi:hypothetical protein
MQYMRQAAGVRNYGCALCLNSASALSNSVELSYGEALRVFWRIYWPSQLMALTAFASGIAIRTAHTVYTLRLSGAQRGGLELGLLVTVMCFYVHRIVAPPYRSFRIEIVQDQHPDSAQEKPFSLKRRIRVWSFLAWRMGVAEAIALILEAPLNIFLSLLGVRKVLWFDTGFVVLTVAIVLIIGPTVLRFLIGYQFSDFRLEVFRFDH